MNGGPGTSGRGFFRGGGRPAAVLLALLAVALYARTLGNGLVYDDDYIFKNAQIVDGVTLSDVPWAFTAAPDGNWIPLTWLSHLLAIAAFGAGAPWHHLIQILLHAANAALLFLFLRRTTGAPTRSYLVALLFAVHPLHVESVAWVAERKDVLSLFFGLLALHAYVGHARKPGGGRYLAVLGWLAAGLMAKPMLVTLPLAFLLLDWWPLNRFPGSRGAVRDNRPVVAGNLRAAGSLLAQKAPLLALAAAAGLLAVTTQRRSGFLGALLLYPPGERAANALLSIAAYLGQLVFPAGLAVFYPHPGASVSRAGAVAAGFALAAATAVFVARRRSQPSLLWGWLWFLVTLLPVAGLIQVGAQARADRYTYISFIGLYTLLVWWLGDLAGSRPRVKMPLAAAAGAAAATLVLLTVRQQGFWKDDVTLFRHAAAVTKNNWVAHHNLGIALAGQGRMEEALDQLGEAVRLLPGVPAYLYDLARVLALSGRYPQAEERFRQLLALTPGDAGAHRDLGAVLKAQGRLREARSALLESLRINPLDSRAQRQLAGLEAEAGSPNGAREDYDRALAADPGDWSAHLGLGRLLAGAGDQAGAERHLRDALRRNPGSVEAHHELALLLDRRRSFAEAADHYAAVVKLQPDSAAARNNLGVDLEETGRFAEAERQYREALRLAPRYVDPVYNLGLLLLRRGRGPEAEELFRRSLAQSPGSAQLHQGLGRVLGLAGKRAAAAAEFEKALALEPGFTQARRDLEAIGGADARRP